MATGGGKAPPPRDVSDPGELRVRKSASGTMKTDVGQSQFYSKVGIRPIHDSMDARHQRDSNIKIKKMTRIYDGSTKFPKLEECAHFHYDFVELRPVQVEVAMQPLEGVTGTDSGNVTVTEDNQDTAHPDSSAADPTAPCCYFYLRVTSDDKCWTIRRTYDNFRMLDRQLHRCIYDRKYSQLPELRKNEIKEDGVPAMRKLLALYMQRFSSISGNMINCGPILSWLEMDNRGNRLIVTDDSAINTPAIAAGHVTKRYIAQASDELTFAVGDMISIIDMPKAEETVWWRGKKGFEVGFFPCECVEIIGDKIPQSVSDKIPDTKPVLRKRGKLITFLRAFFTSRPARTTLKRTGIVKERVFGCDLGEHLLNSDHDVPVVLKCCSDLIEYEGIVDGIYRLSGVASNIQKLRSEFDEEREPNLTSDDYLQDIHSISSLLKMYFRELPNPLFTYQLYDKFASAVQDDENKLMKIHDVVQQLPPPHYRTAEYLMRHLNRVASFGHKTGMHCKNLAIVWAPNLLRSKDLEMLCSTAALQGVGIQAIVTEFMIQYADLIFSDKLQNMASGSQAGPVRKSRPKSLAISTPTKLISLEEAREQILCGGPPHSPKQKFIEVGGGAASLPKEYHTVIDLPHKKKSRKDRKSPVTGWRSIFSRSRASSWRGKTDDDGMEDMPDIAVHRSLQLDSHALTEDDIAQRRRLRTVRSADSLLSGASSPRYSDQSGATFVNPYTDEYETVRPKSASMDRAKGTKRSRSYERSFSDVGVLGLDSSLSDEVFGEIANRGAPKPMHGLVTELEKRFTSRLPNAGDQGSRSLPRPQSEPSDPHGGAKPKTTPRSTSSAESAEAMTCFGTPPVVAHYGRSGDMGTSPKHKSPSVSSSASESRYLAGEAAASMSGVSDESFLTNHSQEMSLSPPDVAVVPRDKTVSPTHSGDSVLSGSPGDGTKPRSASYVGKAQLSPIGEMLPVELSESPGTKRKLLTRLSRDYTDLEYMGTEGAACEMASFDGNLTDDENFRAQNMSGTTDSESELERREALSHSDFLNNSREEQQHLAMSVGSLDKVTEVVEPVISAAASSTTLTRSHKSENSLNVPAVQQQQQSAASSSMDLSKSLDSILQDGAGSDIYNSEWERQNSSRMTTSYNSHYTSGEMSAFTAETPSTGHYTSASSMDSDYLDRARFDNLTHSPPAPPVPPPRKRQVRDSYHDRELSCTPTNEDPPYGMPSARDTLHLRVDNTTDVSPPEHFTTDLSPSVHIQRADRPTDFPSNLLYPGSTDIDLSETEVQYVHPRYSNVYTSEDEETTLAHESSSSPPGGALEFSPSPPLPPPPGEYLSSDTPDEVPSPFSDVLPPYREPITRGESGHIVIRRPVEGSAEGALQHAQVSRVVPPKRQVAAAPPPPPVAELTTPDDIPVTEIGEVSVVTSPVDVESPLDEKPSFVDKLTSGDGYMADRSSSASPTMMDIKGPGLTKLDMTKFESLEKINEMSTSSDLMFTMDDVPSDAFCSSDAVATMSSSEDVFASSSDAEPLHRVPIPAPRGRSNILHSPTTPEPESQTSGFTVRSSEQRKPSPTKRKKSVRELLSQFETGKDEEEVPTKSAESPAAFQKAAPVSDAELDSPTRPQGPRSLPADVFLRDSGLVELSQEGATESHSSRRTSSKANIPVPIRSTSPPLVSRGSRLSRSPLASMAPQPDSAEQDKGFVEPVVEGTNSLRRSHQNPEDRWSKKGLHGDTRSSTSLSEKLRQFEQLGASSDASSTGGGTLERTSTLVSTWRSTGTDPMRTADSDSASSATAAESELVRKMNERRQKMSETVSDSKENKDPEKLNVIVNPAPAKGSLKWKYGSKDRPPTAAEISAEISTSEDDVAAWVQLRRSRLDAQATQVIIKDNTQSLPEVGHSNGNVEKRDSLSLAERRRQFESADSLQRGSDGSSRDSSDREVSDRHSSVRDLQERFERQSAEREETARSSVASGAANRGSACSRGSVFGDSGYHTVEDDRSWNTIL